MALCATAAAAISIYLLAVSRSQSGLPAGCGAESGCAEVLASRWSSILGIPVSAPALGVHAAALAGVALIGPSRISSQRRIGWTLLMLCGAILLFAALWFIGLQVFVLKAICPWCMADHALGLILAGLIFAQAPIARSGREVADREPSFDRLGVALLALTGFLCVATLAGGQALQTPASRIARLPAGKNADTGPGPGRALSVVDGKFALLAHEEPILGSPDAPKLLVVLFDYCCPHCRQTHQYLEEARAREQGRLATLMLPCPLNSRCNPHWEADIPRFEHSCELARIALAVWRADPSAFAEFDAWLFEPETPRDPADARARAAELATPERLEQALAEDWIDEQITRNVAMYGQSGADAVPVLMAPTPSFRPIVGRYETAEELFQTLDQELGEAGEPR